MSDTIIFLQLEHGTLAKLLALVESLRGDIADGKDPDFLLLRLIFDYFHDYPDACHHPKEDAVFRALLQKDPASAERVGNLIGDHEALSRLTEETARRVDAASRNGSEGWDGVIEVLDTFLRAYRGHLEAEEEHFFPLATQRLDKLDWAAIDFDVFDRTDPLYDETKENRFRRLRHVIFRSAATGESPVS